MQTLVCFTSMINNNHALHETLVCFSALPFNFTPSPFALILWEKQNMNI